MKDDLNDLDKLGLIGLAGSDEDMPSSRMSGLQVFVIVMLLLFVAIVVFSGD